MNEPRHGLYAGRGFARRSIELECELYTSKLDEPLLSWSTDLSESGMFVETSAPLAAGEELVISFCPAVHWSLPELTVFAQVARSAPGHPAHDVERGMGIRFLDLAASERRALSRWLKPRPRLLPSRARPRPPGLGSAAPRNGEPKARTPLGSFGEHPFAARVG